MALSVSELVQKTKILTTNGVHPDAQDILNGIGYGPATLTQGAGYADAVSAGQAATQSEKAAQTRATRAERTARAAAHSEAASFTATARVLFADDPPALLALGLQTQYETVTNPETGESEQVAVRPSQGTAEVIAHWTMMFENVSRLEAAQIAALTGAGWPATRVTAALALVAAYSDADVAQQAAIQTYQARSTTYLEDVKTLRNWYTRANQLCKIAIKDADPKNAKQLLEMLGLA